MKLTKISGFFLLTLLIASCTHYKDIVYLQDKEDAEGDSIGIHPNQIPTYKIQTRDILYIRIVSMNKDVTEVINLNPPTSGNMFNNEASLYINGYNVDNAGYVELPIIGRIMVVDKTLEEAKLIVTNQILKHLKDPTVIVKLISFKFSVFGEVNQPGSYVNYNNQLTILEAISQAGDVSPYSNLHKVMVIRTQENSTQTMRLDLTDKNILTSEGYYLLPNDVVYVEPVKSRNFRNNITTYSLILGAISTVILVWSFVRSM